MSCRRDVDGREPGDQRLGRGTPGSGDTTGRHQVVQYLGHDESPSLLLCKRKHFYQSTPESLFLMFHFISSESRINSQQKSLNPTYSQPS